MYGVYLHEGRACAIGRGGPTTLMLAGELALAGPIFAVVVAWRTARWHLSLMQVMSAQHA